MQESQDIGKCERKEKASMMKEYQWVRWSERKRGLAQTTVIKWHELQVLALAPMYFFSIFFTLLLFSPLTLSPSPPPPPPPSISVSRQCLSPYDGEKKTIALSLKCKFCFLVALERIFYPVTLKEKKRERKETGRKIWTLLLGLLLFKTATGLPVIWPSESTGRHIQPCK